MHERSLVSALLNQAESIRQSHAAERVLAIKVTVGEFSGVEADLLKSAFEEMAIAPTIRGAALHIERVSLQCVCRDCGHSTVIERFQFECRQCQGRQLDIVRGEEMMLESLTLAGE